MLFLSIITVHFREVDGLAQTMESFLALRNRFKHVQMEWIVVDGGTDFSAFSDLKDSIKTASSVFISEKDHGLYDAMNKGLAVAGGVYSVFMNAGDLFTPEFDLNELVGMGASQPGLILGGAYEALPGDEPNLKLPRSVDSLWYGMPTHHQAMLMRTDLARQYGYDLKLKIAADFKLVCQIAKTSGVAIAVTNTPLCHFELGGVSTTRFWLGLDEQQMVRREVLGVSRVKNCLVYALKSFNRIARGVAPSLYKSLRYVKGSSS